MLNRHLWMVVAFLFPFGTTPVMNTMESPHSLWTTSSAWYGLSSFLWTTPALNCMNCPHSCGSHKLWMVWIVWIPVDHTSFERYRLPSFLWTTPALKDQQSSLSLWTTPMSLTSYSRGPAMTEKAKWWITLPDKGAAIRMLAVVLVLDFCCWFLK